MRPPTAATCTPRGAARCSASSTCLVPANRAFSGVAGRISSLLGLASRTEQLVHDRYHDERRRGRPRRSESARRPRRSASTAPCAAPSQLTLGSSLHGAAGGRAASSSHGATVGDTRVGAGGVVLAVRVIQTCPTPGRPFLEPGGSTEVPHQRSAPDVQDQQEGSPTCN